MKPPEFRPIRSESRSNSEPRTRTPYRRLLPVGAELQPKGGAHFRVWSPDHSRASVVLHRPEGDREIPLKREPGGYASAFVAAAKAGDLYRFRVGRELLADPASRFQPEGPFGPSEVIDPEAYRWSDSRWKGATLPGTVLYEMHVGTFTPGGTWRSAMERLPDLLDVGVSAVEVMPVADFAGRFGWGYDGVFPFAPTRLYGRPDDFKAFVDRAHSIGLAVLLDVVYNHLGPSGCVFRRYAKAYFSKRYPNEWGDPLNFDGRDSAPVREYFVANAGYWIREFHLDGLRLDATQSVHDASRPHVLADVTRAVRRGAQGRSTLVFCENEPQQAGMVREFGMDGIWNDDFHHSAFVAATGRNEAYYTDHTGAPQELVSAARHGFLFQGQRYAWQNQSRGSSTLGIPPAAFVVFIENHDQLANTGDGSRIHFRTSPGRWRALTALLLLVPSTPLLFQGQEMASTRPFLYFADHEGGLAEAVRRGRAQFISQFPSLASREMQTCMPSPNDPATFERCRLDWRERETHAAAVALHRDLIRLRRTEEAFRRQDPVDGAVLGPEAFVLRFRGKRNDADRLLIVNLGCGLSRPSIAEPLLAPPEGRRWAVLWSSEHPAYGGGGTPDGIADPGWRLPSHAAVVLGPESNHDPSPKRR